jgi:hypothetical protein
MAKKNERVEAVEGQLLRDIQKLTSQQFVYEDLTQADSGGSDAIASRERRGGKTRGNSSCGAAITLEERLQNIESMLAILVGRQQPQEYYTTLEAATILGLAVFTVREYCRLGRLRAEKRQSGRAGHRSWVIARTEIDRFRRHGLLPG